MLTISFDSRYPQAALESCVDLVELLGDLVATRHGEYIPDRVAGAVVQLCAAVTTAQSAAIATLNAYMTGPDGRVRPMNRPVPQKAEAPAATPAPSPAAVLAREFGMPEAEAAEMLRAALEIARAGRTAGSAPPATPKLTEPRATASKRRRAA